MKKRNVGFTLVEILIVVIILGILAAIVIPQFTEASSDARESSLVSNLQTLRSQLELYKVQHNDEYPPEATFVQCLTTKTNPDHTAGGTLGPYLQQFPTNPFNSMNTIRFGAVPAEGTDGAGWVFDSATGEIAADDSKETSDGTEHAAL